MITKLDWFGCLPNASWENQIHHTLQALSKIKSISRASLRIEKEATSTELFHLTLMLTMPGPDVLAHGSGLSFQSALSHLNEEAQSKLTQQAVKSVHPGLSMPAAALSIALLVFTQSISLGNPHEVLEPKTSSVLNRQELHVVERIARSTWSMMAAGNFADTRVWPHGVRDQKGRLGLFLCRSLPLLPQRDPVYEGDRRKWVLLGLIAAVKYSEGSSLGHIAFTDITGISGEKWYYDIAIADARDIHRQILSGSLNLDEAYEVIASKWVKVTADHVYSLN